MQYSSDYLMFAQLGKLADELSGEGFWSVLCSVLELLCPLDELAVFHYVYCEPPRRVFDRHPRAERDRLHGELLQTAYLIGPYYNSIVKAQAAAGFYKIDDIAPDAFRESEYYRIYYQEKQAADEGMFFVPLEPGIAVGLLIERRDPSPVFAEEERSLLNSIAPFLTAMIGQRWKLVGAGGASRADVSQHMATNLECFGREVLTERERQTAELILRGHSSKSGARELGISPETERVHRKSVYAKLHISSQAELFWLFIQSVRYFNPATRNDPLKDMLAERSFSAS